MNRITVNTLGFDLTREVPSTIEEYKALAPKRTNPVLEDAVNNILYRDTFADFRDRFVTKLEESTGVKRINHGTEEEPQMESEAKYLKRLIAEKVAAGAKETELRASWLPIAQAEMDASSFDVAERESKGGSNLVGKRDIALAKQVITDGKADAIAAKLATILGCDVPTDEKSLARAIADNRRAIAEKAAADQKAALGL
jgi:hypothetical protein